MSEDAPQDASRRISESRAREIWQRAVELQMEAAQERHRLAAAGDDGAGEISLDAVRAAALEAGIAEEYVSLALAEQSGTLRDAGQLTGWKDRMATRLLGSDARVLEVSEVIPAPPRDALGGLEAVATRRPYRLHLRDTVGDDPLNGAILVFHTPGLLEAGSTPFGSAMSTVGIRELRLVMVPRKDGAATEIRIAAPLGRARKTNWFAASSISGLGGLMTGTMSLGIAAVAGAGLPVAMAALAGSVLAGTWGSSRGLGALYRKSLRTAETELLGLIRSVKVACRMGSGFLPSDEDGGGLGRALDGLLDLG